MRLLIALIVNVVWLNSIKPKSRCSTKSEEKEFIERLWKIMNHPDTIGNLTLIGKSYGDGAIKVEPRALEKLPIPDSVIKELGLPVQLRLFEQPESYQVRTKKPRKLLLQTEPG